MGATTNGARYSGLMDMINGGGAGAAGQTFQGGGILSDIANVIAKPRGYYDRAQPVAQLMQAPMRAAPQPVAAMQSPRPMSRPVASPYQAAGMSSPTGYAPPEPAAPGFAAFYAQLDPEYRRYPPEILADAYRRYVAAMNGGGNGM